MNATKDAPVNAAKDAPVNATKDAPVNAANPAPANATSAGKKDSPAKDAHVHDTSAAKKGKRTL